MPGELCLLLLKLLQIIKSKMKLMNEKKMSQLVRLVLRFHLQKSKLEASKAQ